MTIYESIKTLSKEDMFKFLDQIYCAGLVAGNQAVADKRFDTGCSVVKKSYLDQELVDDAVNVVTGATGEGLIIEPLVRVVSAVMSSTEEDMRENLTWESLVILPKDDEKEPEVEDCDCFLCTSVDTFREAFEKVEAEIEIEGEAKVRAKAKAKAKAKANK